MGAFELLCLEVKATQAAMQDPLRQSYSRASMFYIILHPTNNMIRHLMDRMVLVEEYLQEAPRLVNSYIKKPDESELI